MNGIVIIPLIILGAIAISSTLMWRHERRQRIYAEINAMFYRRMIKRYRERMDKLLDDVRKTHEGRNIWEDQ